MDGATEHWVFRYGRMEWKSGLQYGVGIGIGIGTALTYWGMTQFCRCHF